MCKVSIKIFKCGTDISLILHQFSAFGLTNNCSGACTKIVHVYYWQYFTKFINILNLKVLNLKNFDCPCFNGKLQLWKRLFFQIWLILYANDLVYPQKLGIRVFQLFFTPTNDSNMIKIVTYEDMMLKLYILSTFSLLNLKALYFVS